jgi:hypothetical protein
VVTEGTWDLVADDVTKNATEDSGHHAQDDRNEGWHVRIQRNLGASCGKQTQAHGVRPLHGSLGGLEVSSAHENHCSDAQGQERPDPGSMLNPKQRTSIEQDISDGSSAKGRQAGHHANTHGVEFLARSLQNARQGKRQSGHHFNGQLRV